MSIFIWQELEPRRLLDATLTSSDVSTILARAASQALNTQAIVVVDRTGKLLGEYDKSGLNLANTNLSAARKDLYLGNALNPDSSHEFGYAFAANPRGLFYNGREGPDFDESVAIAGAVHFSAPPAIWANRVFVGGLRLPYTTSFIAHRH